jgi:phosphoglycolate phosphatase-like HAD superfamily hydrolase
MNFPKDLQNETAIEEFERLKIERIFDQELFDDCADTLQKISDYEIPIFVSSSTFQSTIQEYFERKGLSHFFSEIVGYRPGFEKGADHFNHIKESHSIKLEDSVFVGDSLKDFERSLGFCQFIGIERMFSRSDFLNKGHSGNIVKSLSEIPPLLKPIV